MSNISQGLESTVTAESSKVKQHEVYSWFLMQSMEDVNQETFSNFRMKDNLFTI